MIDQRLDSRQSNQTHLQDRTQVYKQLLDANKDIWEADPAALDVTLELWKSMGETGDPSLAIEIVRGRRSLAATKTTDVQEAQRTASLQEKANLAKGIATGERIVTEPTSDYDVYEEAMKEKKKSDEAFDTSDPRFFALLRKHESIAQSLNKGS